MLVDVEVVDCVELEVFVVLVYEAVVVLDVDDVMVRVDEVLVLHVVLVDEAVTVHDVDEVKV